MSEDDSRKSVVESKRLTQENLPKGWGLLEFGPYQVVIVPGDHDDLEFYFPENSRVIPVPQDPKTLAEIVGQMSQLSICRTFADFFRETVYLVGLYIPLPDLVLPAHQDNTLKEPIRLTQKDLPPGHSLLQFGEYQVMFGPGDRGDLELYFPENSQVVTLPEDEKILSQILAQVATQQEQLSVLPTFDEFFQAISDLVDSFTSLPESVSPDHPLAGFYRGLRLKLGLPD